MSLIFYVHDKHDFPPFESYLKVPTVAPDWIGLKVVYLDKP
jgi:hypothetical protein